MTDGQLVAPEIQRLRVGSADPPPERLTLRAGPWRLIYTEGELRTIRRGRHEALRRIYVSLRDRLWNSIPARISAVSLAQETEASFRLTFDAEHVNGEVDFAWQGDITGDAAGTITYRLRGQARCGFWRTRIGFCVLHPGRECAGRSCRVTHVDGRVEESAFPDLVAPHQIFLDMQGIAHEAAPGVWADVRFAGEAFEMEDQRNWGEDSFKSYCTPLRLPYPVWLEAGAVVEQSVTFTLTEPPPTSVRTSASRCLTLKRPSRAAARVRARHSQSVMLRFPSRPNGMRPGEKLGVCAYNGDGLLQTSKDRTPLGA